jgi:hypothetical protein
MYTTDYQVTAWRRLPQFYPQQPSGWEPLFHAMDEGEAGRRLIDQKVFDGVILPFGQFPEDLEAGRSPSQETLTKNAKRLGVSPEVLLRVREANGLDGGTGEDMTPVGWFRNFDDEPWKRFLYSDYLKKDVSSAYVGWGRRRGSLSWTAVAASDDQALVDHLLFFAGPVERLVLPSGVVPDAADNGE